MPTIKNARHTLSLFIFRRDLRLEDNLGLIAALQHSEYVIPCFIIDPRQCEKNNYKGLPSIQFMIESIDDLQEQLIKKSAKLFLFHGMPHDIVEKIILEKKIDAVFFNRDYTPFSQKRDLAIEKICKQYAIALYKLDDTLLNPPESILKPDNTPYQIFSRYYNVARSVDIRQPKKNIYQNYYAGNIHFAMTEDIFKQILPQTNKALAFRGGRNECLKKLKQLSTLDNYMQNHDFPFINATSHLSSYLKFTNCSAREIYRAISHSTPSSESLLRQLYWRDFFTMIAFYFPHVFGHAYRQKYDALEWGNNNRFFTAWCEGKTGFPIVDAGMRELNQTGTMHNRVRLITASFLVKDLHIDWRWGERYFAQKLIDYDPAVNNGNWQWVAGTGTDAQPYFRIFNPWLQQKKFDTECSYIKQWIPELRSFDKKMIHHIYRIEPDLIEPMHCLPIVNHTIEAEKTKKMFFTIDQKNRLKPSI